MVFTKTESSAEDDEFNFGHTEFEGLIGHPHGAAQLDIQQYPSVPTGLRLRFGSWSHKYEGVNTEC